MTVIIDNCDDPQCLFDYTVAHSDCVGKTSKCVKCGRRIKWEEATSINADGDEKDYIKGVTITEPKHPNDALSEGAGR